MTILEAIDARHSVRIFLDKRIEDDIVEKLNAEVEECNMRSGLKIQLITNEPLAFKGVAKYGVFENANNYFVLGGDKCDDLHEKIGYYGEKLVIKAQQLGLNTCWVALTYKKSVAKQNFEKNDKFVCVIAVGYGKTQGVPHKNKKIEKLCNLSSDHPDWYKRGVESALKAPTAVNQQKFYIDLVDGEVLIRAKSGFYKNLDLGIVKYHFEVGAGKENFKFCSSKK